MRLFWLRCLKNNAASERSHQTILKTPLTPQYGLIWKGYETKCIILQDKNTKCTNSIFFGTVEPQHAHIRETKDLCIINWTYNKVHFWNLDFDRKRISKTWAWTVDSGTAYLKIFPCLNMHVCTGFNWPECVFLISSFCTLFMHTMTNLAKCSHVYSVYVSCIDCNVQYDKWSITFLVKSKGKSFVMVVILQFNLGLSLWLRTLHCMAHGVTKIQVL